MEILNQLHQWSWYFLILRGLLLIGEGVYLLRRHGTKSDVLPNAACGILILTFYRYVAGGFAFGVMLYVASFAKRTLEISWGLFLVTLVAADLSFYVYHLSAHHIRLLWADHSVHHTSEQLDFSTNLRNSLFNGMYSWLPLCPVLLLGVNPVLVAACQTLVNDYPFFLHTQHVGKLGRPLEFVFNTPSHHRVHHAYNSEYLNKNFGGILIIWDRLFGTFAEERGACTFGTIEKLHSKNPVKILFYEWSRMITEFVRASGWKSRIRAVVETASKS